jgi:RNA polymerase sigma factor (sigma-70 family)
MVVNINNLPDVDLVIRIKEDACSESFKEISSRHSNLFYKVCQSHVRTFYAMGYNPNDILEDKDIVILEAVQKFDPSKKVKFSTWLGNYTRYFCLNKLNKIKAVPERGTEIEMAATFDAASVERFENTEIPLDLDAIFNTLSSTDDPRISNIFKLRYDTDLTKKRTWAKIAEQLNLTVQTTIQLHKKGLKWLREEIANENLDVFQDTKI